MTADRAWLDTMQAQAERAVAEDLLPARLLLKDVPRLLALAQYQGAAIDAVLAMPEKSMDYSARVRDISFGYNTALSEVRAILALADPEKEK